MRNNYQKFCILSDTTIKSSSVDQKDLNLYRIEAIIRYLIFDILKK